MKTSVIIPTYNKLPRLKLTLASLETQSEPVENFEVIIVDDGSTDQTEHYVKNLMCKLNIKYIKQKNLGRSAARNAGIECASGKYIILLDDDLIVPIHFIESHNRMLDKTSGIVHGQIRNLSYLKFFSDPTNGVLYPELKVRKKIEETLKKKCITEEDIFRNFKERVADNAKISEVELVIKDILEEKILGYEWLAFTGGNVSFPRMLIEGKKLFDEEFGLEWGCEDFEMGYRFMQIGVNFYYCEEAVNYHLVHYRENYRECIQHAMKKFYKKYKDEKIIWVKDFLLEEINRNDFLIKITLHNKEAMLGERNT